MQHFLLFSNYIMKTLEIFHNFLEYDKVFRIRQSEMCFRDPEAALAVLEVACGDSTASCGPPPGKGRDEAHGPLGLGWQRRRHTLLSIFTGCNGSHHLTHLGDKSNVYEALL